MNRCDILLVGYEDQENLGLRTIASFLLNNGIKVEIEPYHPELKENILLKIKSQNPKVVGFSLIFQRMLFDFADLISYLRTNGVAAHFTIGGHFPTLEYEEILKSIPGLNSVVRHEGEYTLLELFKHIDQPGTWTKIRGLAYRGKYKIFVTPPRPLIENLDSLPFSVRSDKPVTHRGLGICSIVASRGCYFDCSFCSIREFYKGASGPKRRTRSPSKVVEEMEQLFNDKGVRIYVFQDDDWCMRGNRQRQWTIDFVEELKKRTFSDQILWRISCRVDELDSELIKRMKEVGLMSIYMGIESGSEQGLKTFNKHYTVADIYRGLDLLQELKTPFEFGFMIFDPDSTIESTEENINFLKRIGKDGQAVVHFSKMVPYAGTPIARRLKQEGRLKGTIASPDYTYEDYRLSLLQLFFSQVFNFRNFNSDGLLERLRFAKFDAINCRKFFSDKYNTKAYTEQVRDLIRQSNESALETMSLALDFIKERKKEEILSNWWFLNNLAQEEIEMELRISSFLEQVIPS